MTNQIKKLIGDSENTPLIALVKRLIIIANNNNLKFDGIGTKKGRSLVKRAKIFLLFKNERVVTIVDDNYLTLPQIKKNKDKK